MARTSTGIVLTLAAVQGSYMLADGVHVVVTGRYFGGSVGPWATLVRAAGFNPYRFGPLFVALGIAWLAAVAGLLFRARFVKRALIALAILSLWYVPVGTVFSLVVLFLAMTLHVDRASLDRVS